jgi:hypothetical protein
MTDFLLYGNAVILFLIALEIEKIRKLIERKKDAKDTK